MTGAVRMTKTMIYLSSGAVPASPVTGRGPGSARHLSLWSTSTYSVSWTCGRTGAGSERTVMVDEATRCAR